MFPSTYAVGFRPRSLEAWRMAAALSSGGFVADMAAADVHGVLRKPNRAVSVLVSRRHHPLDGAHVRQTRSLPDHDTCVVNGLPVLTLERTLVELADRSVSSLRLRNMMHQSKFRPGRPEVDVDLLWETLRRHRNRRGHRVIVDAVHRFVGGSAGSKSETEHRLFEMIRDADVPLPDVNVPVAVANGNHEVDLLWRELRLVVEIDGDFHDEPAVKLDDAVVDAALGAAGYDVIRVHAVAVWHIPDVVVARIHTALERCLRR